MAVRNRLYDAGIKRQVQFDVPVLVVGNIAMGGTGKTPHVEHLLHEMMDTRHIGVLSRGYKRATQGFVLASRRSRPEDIGDESYQIYRKFGPGVTVAVCESRVEGITRMLEIDPKIELIILDDAFQHRAVKPTTAIVLTEYNRPAFEDHLLPYGRLRESMSAMSRADIVVVTKCPDDMKPMEYRIFKEKLRLFPFQKLYFSRYSYGHLVPVFSEDAQRVPALDDLMPGDAILCVTGIANPRPFTRHLRTHRAVVKTRRYPDHHNFSAEDMADIEKAFDSLEGNEKIIVTTEKDAVRLLNNPYFPHQLKPHIFYIPIGVEFIDTLESGPFIPGVERALHNANLFPNMTKR